MPVKKKVPPKVEFYFTLVIRMPIPLPEGAFCFVSLIFYPSFIHLQGHCVLTGVSSICTFCWSAFPIYSNEEIWAIIYRLLPGVLVLIWRPLVVVFSNHTFMFNSSWWGTRST